MDSLSTVLQSKRLSVYSGLILATLWGAFAYAHLTKFQNTQNWTLLLFCLSETLAAGFYIFRSEPKTVSLVPLDWLAAIGGTFAPLLFRPADNGILPWASAAIIAGICIQILGLLSLNRSFALVAAKRKIKSDWMYRIVRHPIYAGYCLIFSGYLLANTTLYNALVYASSLIFLGIRIQREEQHLALDPAYRAYMRTVRYRLLPFIF